MRTLQSLFLSFIYFYQLGFQLFNSLVYFGEGFISPLKIFFIFRINFRLHISDNKKRD